jgi:hypothetical protein
MTRRQSLAKLHHGEMTTNKRKVDVKASHKFKEQSLNLRFTLYYYNLIILQCYNATTLPCQQQLSGRCQDNILLDILYKLFNYK